MHRLVPLAFVALAACGLDVEGELRIDPGDAAPFRFAPTECISGEPLEFFGVDLCDDGHRTLRLVHFPVEGPELVFTDPNRDLETFVLVPQDCRTFRGELKRTDTQSNGVWEMRGELQLDCDAPDGAHVQGKLEFQHCAEDTNDYSGD